MAGCQLPTAGGLAHGHIHCWSRESNRRSSESKITRSTPGPVPQCTSVVNRCVGTSDPCQYNIPVLLLQCPTITECILKMNVQSKEETGVTAVLTLNTYLWLSEMNSEVKTCTIRTNNQDKKIVGEKRVQTNGQGDRSTESWYSLVVLCVVSVAAGVSVPLPVLPVLTGGEQHHVLSVMDVV